MPLTNAVLNFSFLFLLSLTAFADSRSTWKTTIAFGSCTDSPTSQIWSRIAATKPDAMLLLGDNIYMVGSEWEEPGAIRARYNALKNDPEFSALAKLVPTYAVWDDHDFGPNNADSTFPFKSNSLGAFREMFSSNPPPPVGLEGSVAFEKKIGDVLVLMTDNRTYRVTPRKKKAGVMFGEAQLSWLEKRIASPDAKAVILASGNEFLPNQGGTQTLFPYSQERARIWRAISSSMVPVIILSGDRHYGQIMVGKMGFNTVMEVSSSPLTAKPRNQVSKITFRDELQTVSSVGGSNNFGLLVIEGFDDGSIRAVAELHLSDGFVAGRAQATWPLRNGGGADRFVR